MKVKVSHEHEQLTPSQRQRQVRLECLRLACQSTTGPQALSLAIEFFNWVEHGSS